MERALHLGEQFRSLSDCIGYRAAVRLCRRFGGLEKVYIPKNASAGHRLRPVLGDDSFAQLTQRLGGQSINIPKPPRVTPSKAGIMDDLIAGEKSVAEIALRHGVTTRWVRKVRRELREAGRIEPLPQEAAS